MKYLLRAARWTTARSCWRRWSTRTRTTCSCPRHFHSVHDSAQFTFSNKTPFPQSHFTLWFRHLVMATPRRMRECNIKQFSNMIGTGLKKRKLWTWPWLISILLRLFRFYFLERNKRKQSYCFSITRKAICSKKCFAESALLTIFFCDFDSFSLRAIPGHWGQPPGGLCVCQTVAVCVMLISNQTTGSESSRLVGSKGQTNSSGTYP